MTADLTPAKVRCEYLANPLGVDVARPRLNWTLQSVRRAQRQSAYQILVSDSEEGLCGGRGDLWDSGRIESERSVHIPYEGPELASGQRVWWAVRVWNGDGEASAYSEPVWWEMGLLRPDDWQGGWIGPAPDASNDPGVLLPADEERGVMAVDLAPSPYLRTTFTVSQAVARARLYVTARGLYEARLNGQRVGDAVLAPGWTDYRKRIQYQTYRACVVTHWSADQQSSNPWGKRYSGASR